MEVCGFCKLPRAFTPSLNWRSFGHCYSSAPHASSTGQQLLFWGSKARSLPYGLAERSWPERTPKRRHPALCHSYRRLLEVKLDFGKYEGKKLRDVPPEYLEWMVRELKVGDRGEWSEMAKSVLKDPEYRRTNEAVLEAKMEEYAALSRLAKAQGVSIDKLLPNPEAFWEEVEDPKVKEVIVRQRQRMAARAQREAEAHLIEDPVARRRAMRRRKRREETAAEAKEMKLEALKEVVRKVEQTPAPAPAATSSRASLADRLQKMKRQL